MAADGSTTQGGPATLISWAEPPLLVQMLKSALLLEQTVEIYHPLASTAGVIHRLLHDHKLQHTLLERTARQGTSATDLALELMVFHWGVVGDGPLVDEAEMHRLMQLPEDDRVAALLPLIQERFRSGLLTRADELGMRELLSLASTEQVTVLPHPMVQVVIGMTVGAPFTAMTRTQLDLREMALSRRRIFTDSDAGRSLEQLVGDDRPDLRDSVREAQLGAGLLQQLPSFSTASVADVLAIRHELARHLDRFHVTLASLEASLSSDEPVHPEDARRLWRSTVAPALQELDDAIESNSDIRVLRDVFVDHGGVATAAAAAGAASVALLAGSPVLAGLSALLVEGGSLALTAARDLAEAKRQVQLRPFYFLYRTENLLQRPR